ncbi:hypothetical protein GW17_00011020 [Ensete ventricosum]|nr:hypothetical protein GW17_00011020 [Ensete ventricosum]
MQTSAQVETSSKSGPWRKVCFALFWIISPESLLCSSGYADMDMAATNQPIKGSFLKLLPTQMEMPESQESSPHSSSSSLDQPPSRNR